MHSGGPRSELCAYCPKLCRHACPVAVAESSEAATPAAKGTLLDLHRRGHLPLAGAVADAAYRCCDCRLQQTHCRHGVDATAEYREVRERAFGAGVAPEPVVRYAARVRALGRPFRTDLAAVLESRASDASSVASAPPAPGPAAPVPTAPAPTGAPAVLLPIGAPAPLALFPGCTTLARRPALWDAARFVLARLEEAEGGPPVPTTQAASGCCGYPLLAAGDRLGFLTLARRIGAACARVDRLLVLDPGCAEAFEAARAAGVRLPEVTTLVEHLAERLSRVEGLITRPLAGSVTYHDPCLLGRVRGVYDGPRALLRAAFGGEVPLEPPTTREEAWCSGGGGIYAKLRPEAAARVASRRRDELNETGASTLATACPSAALRLERAGADERVWDVVELLARAMGGPCEPDTRPPGDAWVPDTRPPGDGADAAREPA